MRIRQAVWLACLALGACLGDGDGDGVVPPLGTTASISIFNGTPLEIARVYVEPSPTFEFYRPRNDAPIAPGSTFVVSGLEAGNWDVLASADGAEAVFLALAWDVPVAAGETVALSFSPADFGGKLELTNGGASDITALDIGWSFALDAPLAPGQTIVVPVHVDPGTYDVRCDFAGGGSSTVTSVVVTALEVTPLTCG